MCGRYTLTRHERIVEVVPNITIPSKLHIVDRFNIAPTQSILAVANTAKLEAELMHWGLVPFWAKDKAIGNRMINARAETLTEKPAFKKNLEKHRCVILADGFYEWRKHDDGSKTPMYIHLKDYRPFAFAGLWDVWRDEEANEKLISCTIITTEPNELMATIHNRMPVILPHEAVLDWLDEKPRDGAELSAWLKPFPASEMLAHPVSRRVNTPANDSPDLVQPATAQPPEPPAPSPRPSRKRPPARSDNPGLFG